MRKFIRQIYNHKYKILINFLVLITALNIYSDNKSVSVNSIEVQSEKLPKSFRGFKIAHISDLHISSYGNFEAKVAEDIKNLHPDIIVITGDLVDGRNYQVEPCLKFIDQIIVIAPVYFVSGNHEWYNQNFISFSKQLEDKGVEMLRNRSIKLTKGKDEIDIMGIDDPEIVNTRDYDNIFVGQALSKATSEIAGDSSFKLLLSHRPEFFDLYSKYGIDLTLSGHAHGGQIRIPFIGGLYAPNQGFFPKYTTGLYTSKGSQMVVTRGIGNSIFPIRINNKPEIILVSLY